jgi:hypothetical protein
VSGWGAVCQGGAAASTNGACGRSDVQLPAATLNARLASRPSPPRTHGCGCSACRALAQQVRQCHTRRAPHISFFCIVPPPISFLRPRYRGTSLCWRYFTGPHETAQRQRPQVSICTILPSCDIVSRSPALTPGYKTHPALRLAIIAVSRWLL